MALVVRFPNKGEADPLPAVSAENGAGPPFCNPLEEGFLQACRPPDRRKVWEWAEDHVKAEPTSNFPGPWRSSTTPWAREPLEQLQVRHVRTITIKCAAQCAKTATMMVGALWVIDQDPGPLMWVMAAKDDCELFLRDRFGPSARDCETVREKIITELKDGFVFSTMPLYFTGTGSDAKLQSKPIRWMFCDEVRNYPSGALEMLLKRVRTFENNSKVLIVSTPGKEKDHVDRAYLEGDQRVYHVPCPECGHFQPLKFEQMKWETSEKTKPGGKWNYDALAPTIRYECVACKARWKDGERLRRQLCTNGKFIALNPNASKSDVSFHFNALLPWNVSWRKTVEEFLKARAAAKSGDIKPMFAFVTETLGEAWKDELGIIDDFSFLEERKGDWKIGDAWPEEQFRMISADAQTAGGEHYFYVCRAVGPGGRSRLVSYGRAETLEELEETRKALNVPTANAMIDTGDGNMTAKLYGFCLNYGWKAFKGDDVDGYIVKDAKTGKNVRKLWKISRVDPHQGKSLAGRYTIPLYRFSNEGVKDHFFARANGTVPGWELPADVGSEYLRQLSAEVRVEEDDKNGHPRWIWKRRRKENHYLDCELQIDVALIASEKVAPPIVTPKGANTVQPLNLGAISEGTENAATDTHTD